MERYQLHAQARNFSPATITHVKRCVGFFADFLGPPLEVSRVTGDDLRRFIVHLKTRTARENCPQNARGKLSPVSINTYVRAVKSFWSWLAAEGVIKENLLARVAAPRLPRKLPRIYSEAELRTVLDYVRNSPRNRAMVELLIDSGIRLSELTTLMVPDIDLPSGRIKVFGKGSKERYAYISPGTALTIHHYLYNVRPQPRTEDCLFLAVDGYPLASQRVQKILEVIGRQAGLKARLSAHRLRHTYATLCLKNGNNLEYIRITLGHSDIKTTSDAYLAASDTDVASACKRSSPLANLLRPGRSRRAIPLGNSTGV